MRDAPVKQVGCEPPWILQEPDIMCKSGVTYIIECGGGDEDGDNPFKVGSTKGLAKSRCAQLQTGSPYTLEVLYVFRGRHREREIHKALHVCGGIYRLSGEWYAGFLLPIVEELCGVGPAYDYYPYQHLYRG